MAFGPTDFWEVVARLLFLGVQCTLSTRVGWAVFRLGRVVRWPGLVAFLWRSFSLLVSLVVAVAAEMVEVPVSVALVSVLR